MHPGPVRHARRDDALFRLHLGARVFARGVKERRAAEVLVRLFVDSHVEECEDLRVRVRRLRGALAPAGAELLVQLLQVGDDEVVLRAQQRVQRGLGHVRFAQDPVDADDADALFGEQFCCSVQQPLARARPVPASLRWLLLAGGGQGKLLRASVAYQYRQTGTYSPLGAKKSPGFHPRDFTLSPIDACWSPD